MEISKKALVTSSSSSLGAIAGQLGERSRRTYESDARMFASWLEEHDLQPGQIDRVAIAEYRGWLVATYRPATAKRMFSVARQLLAEAVYSGVLPANPAEGVKGIKAEDESPHIALMKEQAQALLTSIDLKTLKGQRDSALLLTLLYTGIRRFECAALTLDDLGMDQGHHILFVSGKGNRREHMKLRVEVWRAIQEYLTATGRANLAPSAPLFCQFRKGDHVIEAPISPMVVYRTVLEYARIAGIEGHLTPHGMRASFVTLSLEGGAKLEQVQIAARHKDPRTTERYWRRKNNLDDNAVDYIKL